MPYEPIIFTRAIIITRAIITQVGTIQCSKIANGGGKLKKNHNISISFSINQVKYLNHVNIWVRVKDMVALFLNAH